MPEADVRRKRRSVEAEVDFEYTAGELPQLDNHESFELLQSWGEHVVAKDRPGVVDHYAWKGTLWPTLSNVLRQDPDEIEDYFVLFLGKINGKDDVIWNEKVAQPVSEDAVMWSGIYTFGLNDGPVKARFSYLVRKVDGYTMVQKSITFLANEKKESPFRTMYF